MARRKTVTARPRRATARASRAGPAGPPLDLSPARYIRKADRRTGAEIPGPIDPDELLVHAHRDNHPVEVAAQFLASRVIQLTGNEARVGRAAAVNRLGTSWREGLGALTGSPERRAASQDAAGRGRPRRRSSASASPRTCRRARCARASRSCSGRRAPRLKARGRNPRLHVLLTGATGFLGKEILAQAADDRRIAEIVAVVRPETIRDPKTKEVVKVLSPPAARARCC